MQKDHASLCHDINSTERFYLFIVDIAEYFLNSLNITNFCNGNLSTGQEKDLEELGETLTLFTHAAHQKKNQ